MFWLCGRKSAFEAIFNEIPKDCYQNVKSMAVTLKDHLQAHRIFVNMMIKKRRLMMTLSPSCSTRSSWILSMKPLLGFLQSIIRVRQNLYYYYYSCSCYCYCYCYHNHPSSASGRTFTEILISIIDPTSDDPQFPQKYYLQSWPPHVQWHGPRLPTFADFTLN